MNIDDLNYQQTREASALIRDQLAPGAPPVSADQSRFMQAQLVELTRRETALEAEMSQAQIHPDEEALPHTDLTQAENLYASLPDDHPTKVHLGAAIEDVKSRMKQPEIIPETLPPSAQQQAASRLAGVVDEVSRPGTPPGMRNALLSTAKQIAEDAGLQMPDIPEPPEAA